MLTASVQCKSSVPCSVTWQISLHSVSLTGWRTELLQRSCGMGRAISQKTWSEKEQEVSCKCIRPSQGSTSLKSAASSSLSKHKQDKMFRCLGSLLSMSLSVTTVMQMTTGKDRASVKFTRNLLTTIQLLVPGTCG